MLAAKVEDMINTVVRQIAFYRFERKVHTERRNGELTADKICELWMSVQGESLGPGDRVEGRLRGVLDLHPALHPFAVLCLCLCLRRLPGEFALCGLRESASVSPSVISRCWRPAAPSIIPNCSRRSASTPATPSSGTAAERDRRLIDELEALDGLSMAPPRDANKTASPPAPSVTPMSAPKSAAWPRASRPNARSGGGEDRAGNALALAAALGGLKGPMMKVAQLLATIPDAAAAGIRPANSPSCRPSAADGLGFRQAAA